MKKLTETLDRDGGGGGIFEVRDVEVRVRESSVAVLRRSPEGGSSRGHSWFVEVFRRRDGRSSCWKGSL